MIEYSDVVEIIRNKDTRSSAIKYYIESEDYYDDQWVTRIIDLDKGCAAEFVPIIRAIIPQYGHLVAHNSSNSLIITDRYLNLLRVKAIIEEMDKKSPKANCFERKSKRIPAE